MHYQLFSLHGKNPALRPIAVVGKVSVVSTFDCWAESLNSVTNSDVADTDGVEVPIEL